MKNPEDPANLSSKGNQYSTGFPAFDDNSQTRMSVSHCNTLLFLTVDPDIVNFHCLAVNGIGDAARPWNDRKAQPN